MYFLKAYRKFIFWRMRISFPWLDLRQYFSSVSSIWLVGRVGSNSLPHRPSSLPYCSAFSPGIRRADIRRTFSGYLSFPFVSSTTPNQKLYLSGGYPASGYLVRLLARPAGSSDGRRRGHIQQNRRAKSKKRKSCLWNQRSGGRIYAGYPWRHGWDF